MNTTDVAESTGADAIAGGGVFLGIEFGSTRVKAALIDDAGRLLAAGTHTWQNEHIDSNWTYSLEAVWTGLRECYSDLAANVRTQWDTNLVEIAGIGVSAMMHGYLVFDEGDELLVPFRTWRNTYTTDAAALLTETFGQNVPLRWSISHLLHSVLNGEEHVDSIAYMTTLAGYVHWQLSGRKVLGVGDASGVFPIDSSTGDYDAAMIDAFDGLDAVKGVPWKLADIVPEVLDAGEKAGALTAEGARLLDPTGTLSSGAVMAPPEGDAGTGMVATNSVRPHTGNVSAGTSAFAMVVLDEKLAGVREEIDHVTTPAGDPVAMIHTNNCTGDLDAWMQVFREFARLIGHDMDATELYRLLFGEGMNGKANGGGLLAYNYLSGEHQTGVPSGRPLFVRSQGAEFTLANFMRTQLYSAFGALACGMEVLLKEERVQVDAVFAHGGIFRTQQIAQQVLADALETPVSVSDSAGEGGSWGMALLAAYAGGKQAESTSTVTLAEYLTSRIFADVDMISVKPDPEGVRGYAEWLKHYHTGLQVERLAGNVLD